MSTATSISEILPRRPAEPEIRRWTSGEYYHFGAEGLFDCQRVQLINGEVINMPPMGHNHSGTVDAVTEALRSIFAPAHWVRMQFPLNISPLSVPEPDVAVAEFPKAHYTDHPTSAILVVEVSDTTLRLDRRKIGLYASAGIPEYWLVNLPADQIEVYRNPIADPGNEFGFKYADTKLLGLNDSISPLTRPDRLIRVLDLMQ